MPGDSERYWGRGLRRLFSTRHPPAFGSVACSICQGGAIEGRSFPCSSPLALHLSRDLSQSQEQKRLLGNGLPPRASFELHRCDHQRELLSCSRVA